MWHTKSRQFGHYILKLYNLKSIGPWWNKELTLENKSMYHCLYQENLSKKERQPTLTVWCNEMALHLGAIPYLVADQ